MIRMVSFEGYHFIVGIDKKVEQTYTRSMLQMSGIALGLKNMTWRNDEYGNYFESK